MSVNPNAASTQLMTVIAAVTRKAIDTALTPDVIENMAALMRIYALVLLQEQTAAKSNAELEQARADLAKVQAERDLAQDMIKRSEMQASVAVPDKQ